MYAPDLVFGPASGPPPLLWVNHNAKSRSAQPHRRAVFSHVQSSYKKWKRQEDALSLRKSARIPSSCPVQGQELNSGNRSDTSHNSRQSVLRQGLLYADDTIEKDIRQHHLELVISQTNPQTFVDVGNSDPFHAFAIPIDARVAHVMTYTSDLYLPGIYRHHKLSDRKAASVQAFDEIVAFLHDECTAYPHLARIAAVMPKESAQIGSVSQSVKYKTKGLAALRKKLMSSNSLLDPKIPASALLFLTAELYDGHLEAASFHARILVHILEADTITIDFWFLFKVIYHDVQRACLSLVRPALDLETWLPQKFAALSLTTTLLTPDGAIDELHRPVDSSVTSSTIRALILEARYCRDTRLLITQDQTLANNQTNWSLGCRTMACVGRTISCYLDSRALMKKYENLYRTGVSAARAEAYFSLSLLYMLRCEAKMDIFQIGHKDTIFHSNPLILSRMKELLELDSNAITSRMRLYALFIGAYDEQARAVVAPEVPERSWFNVNFANQCTKLGLWDWRDVREILLHFHYSDALQPHGSIWFWKTMNANVRPSFREQIPQSEQGTLHQVRP